MKKYIYFFGGGKADGNGSMKDILGGKGAGLAEMTRSGVPVPAGFTISTEVCNIYFKKQKSILKKIDKQMLQYISQIEKVTGKNFGSTQNPLLLSVRSGAKFSMPGMMDTILNIGLNDKTVEALSKNSQNPRFAYDCYRRLIQMFGNVVLGIDKSKFESKLDEIKKRENVKNDVELSIYAMRDIVDEFKEIIRRETKKEFPQDALTQLRMSRDAVFNSWNNPRAKVYRKLNNIPEHLGTAVNIQQMVFGNYNDKSATGVGFTRDPATGEKSFYGEYLPNAQGEDVVAGIRTPKQILEMSYHLPEAYQSLIQITKKLEKHYKDVQDFEFTIEDGKLYMLQTRNAKRTGIAAVKIAADMIREKLISPQEAIMRLEPEDIEQLLHPIFDPVAKKKFEVIARGLNASPGAAAGRVVFESDDAINFAKKGDRTILVRNETSPDDIKGMHVSKGFLTATGGRTSHAAVVGRQMGKPAVVGCSSIKIDEHNKTFFVGDKTIREGDYISIDGTTGEVILGDVPTKESEIISVIKGKLSPDDSQMYKDFALIMSYANKFKRLGVRANADIPRDAEIAIKLGAEGIGLCRTEHMFFAEDRLPIVQELIMAKTEQERRVALDKLLPLQKDDFKGLFRAMNKFPVTIRTIDPPLHEFAPKREEVMLEIQQLKFSQANPKVIEEKEKLLHRIEELHEFNPMLGHRGCRLGITYPEITEMQARAIFEAACEVLKEGIYVFPEVMIPLVGHISEIRNQKQIVKRVAEDVMKRHNVKIKYSVGTMIEVPRACVNADEIAKEAEFFSFGTNDLTQMGFGFSRDDAGKFLRYYLDKGILEKDPFQTIDTEGIGKLIEIAVEKGRSTRKDLKIGICGEHGGEKLSIYFCHKAKLDYVSCSPFRIPSAQLASAKINLLENLKKQTKKQKIASTLFYD